MFSFPNLSILGVVQIICIIHAVKTGRTNPWLYLLLFLPGISAILYVVIEVLPEFTPHLHQLTYRPPSLAELTTRATTTPTITNLENLAQAYVRTRQPEKAIPLYQLAIAKDPESYPDLHRQLAQCYFTLKRFTEAHREWETLSQTDDYHPDDEAMLARTLVAIKQTTKAYEHFKHAIPRTLHLEHDYHYGKLLLSLHKHDELKALIKSSTTKYQELTPRLQHPEKPWLTKLQQLK